MYGRMKLFLLCLLVIQLVGCRGCTQQKKPAPTANDAEEKKKLRRLNSSGMRAMPFDEDSPTANADPNFVKPGHWYQANSKLKANYDDESLNATLTVINREGKRVPFAAGQPHLEFNRSFSLAKGQEKNIRLRFFQPEVAVTGDDADDRSKVPSQLVAVFTQRSLGTSVDEKTFPNKILAGYQYNIVSISRDPSRYTFWRKQDCIVWPSKSRMSDERIAPHRIIDLKEDQVASQFPDRLYAMTSISHLVINDSSVSILTTDQQNALQDWLHFGGTIILNGPDAIGGIDSSFLKELAPLTNTSNSVVSQDEMENLNSTWSIKQVLGAKVPFSAVKPIPKLGGQLSPGSSWVEFQSATGETNLLGGLVAERLVGQGRIVMTSFPLTDSAFLSWPSYSSFIHNVLLRKPNRKVTTGLEADTKFAGEMENTELNPIHSTRMRIWARDLDSTMVRQSRTLESPASKKRSGAGEQAKMIKPNKRSSLGAWNPESLVLHNARSSLQASSGITVPRINTIVKLLLGYLIVLVPLNWIVFRIIGRVELAWAAAPIIAIAGAFIVARSVQLDVGFSRSQTSQGFLEVHEGYSRGLLSKYTALYTSLSTNYRAVYDQDDGVVLPLSTATLPSKRSRQLGALSKIDYWYADESGSGLQSIPVLSNTTGLLQSEEMLDLGGELGAKFENDLSSVSLTWSGKVPIQDIGIVGLDASGRMLSAWLGTPESGVSIKCVLEQPDDGEGWRREWNKIPTLAAPNFLRADETFWTDQDLGEELYLGPTLDQIVKTYPLGKGEFIAVGWTNKMLGNLTITPAAKQNKERTVVLLHLKGADLEPVRPDNQIFETIREETQ